MALTDTAVKNSKSGAKPRKKADERGLFLLLHPNGSKYWRFKYRFAGKEKLLALGVYPDVSLAAARDRRDAARKLVAEGKDPGSVKRLEKLSLKTATENTFESIAREWFIKFAPQWAPGHAVTIIRRLERDIFPWMGSRPIAEITARELHSILSKIELRGAIETTHRALQNCSQVFRFAVRTGRAERDPAADLRGALAPVEERHHASVTEPKAIGALMRAIAGYEGSMIARCALKLAPLVFVRPGELRHAEWAEFDLGNAEWRIPGPKMKMKEQHIVPLSLQAVAVLRELNPVTGAGKYVFPSVRTNKRPMSANTVLAALRRLGYEKDEMSGHGFRSMASTILNEQGWHRDAIERQLAHAERDAIRAAYNYAEHLVERKRMMQAWADYLDSLRQCSDVK